jgi:hypothetical protein
VIQLFCGYDSREAVGYHVFCASVLDNATRPVSFTPLAAMGLPQGSNAFTLSRFLVPRLSLWKGHAIFADACDMVMLGDVAKLDALFDDRYAVQVVKHPDYATRHPVKYRGTPMECTNTNYPRKNWASLMLVNCQHPAWRDVSPAALAQVPPLGWLQFRGLDDSDIGALPPEWNCLADEGHDVKAAKVLHWTAGIPAFDAYRAAPGAREWHRYRSLIDG